MSTPKDRRLLQDLAKRVAEVAALPIMAERRNMWKRHNRLERVRPMILVFPEGAWRELLPARALACESEESRRMEWNLRHRLFYREDIPDDTVIENEWIVTKAFTTTGWGLEPKLIPSRQATGAHAFVPVINTPADLVKLRHPQVSYDERATQRRLEEAHELFDGILDVKLRGVRTVSFHMMNVYCGLRGHENVLMDMCANPSMLHDAMKFIEEGYHGLVRQWQDLDLLSLNNDSAYHSSGGVSYTDELPRPDHDPARVRLSDLWASAEAQEMAAVSPDMHEEFVLQYEQRLLEPFGLNGYGCCEDLTLKLDAVLRIPNIRRVSISPFADVDACAQKLDRKAIFSWKPHPSHIVGGFDAEHVRRYIRHTLDVTRGCVIEMILKDTHTCENRPERFTEWTRLARQLAEAF